MHVADATLQMPSLFGRDVLQSPMLSLSIDGAIQDEQLQIRQLDTESEYGQLQIQGEVPLAELFADNLTETIGTWQ